MIQGTSIGKAIIVGILLFFVSIGISPCVAETQKGPTSQGNWLYVGGSGPGNYTQIQDAINASSNGDTVFVYDNSSPYNESISITHSIRLLGENPISTIITSQKYCVIQILADNVTIERFSIINMNYSNPGIRSMGNSSIITNNIINSGGIHFHYTSNVTITHNMIQGKRGIYLWETTGTEIENNTISVQITGIYVLRSLQTRIVNNYLNNNTQGIFLIESSFVNVTNNIITDATFFGIDIQDTLQTNHISGNMITSCNMGIYLCLCENQIIKSNTILDNEVGINLLEANRNLINQNDFLENTINALFNDSYKNIWNRNFWDHPRILPYTIAGTIIIYRWPLRWFNFDWHPAQEPYDIKG